jgi:flagellar basal body L-ring protein FlgH
MKNLINSLLIVVALTSCEKTSPEPKEETQKGNSVVEKCGPYGKESTWKSIGGDTLYAEKLTLTFFFTEKNTPCNICYYQQNFALWNDYDYTFSISECANVNDTLTLIDIDTKRKAIFKREN